MSRGTAILNVLPRVSDIVQIYFTVIDNIDALNNATITSCTVVYGNAAIVETDKFIAYDNNPIAIIVTADWLGETFVSILYTKCVYKNIIPDNYTRLIQKLPLGVFTNGINDQLIGDERQAVANMLNDYYRDYFAVIDQVYSNEYSKSLEFEYNGTGGLLSNSTYPNQLFQLLATLSTVHLNTYDLELFVSKYIYYRTGVISAVYINDHISQLLEYWILNLVGRSELDMTTILAPESYQPVLANLKWTIYNSSTFDAAFQREITLLVLRISRADIGNHVFFSDIADPTLDGFQLIGPTYPLDPRLIYDKATQYIGDAAFPLNIIGYKKIFGGEEIIIVADIGSEIDEIEVGPGEILGGEIDS